MSFYYHYPMQNGIIISNTIPSKHAEQLGKLQKIAFPTLDPAELMRPEHYYKHVELFPEGQFVALDGTKVVGSTSSIRQHFDFKKPNHTFAELLAGGWMTAHEEDGDWLYGMDVAVHPDYRRRSISRALYIARQKTVRLLGLKGQLAGGMMIGYDKYRHQMSPQGYFAKLKKGEITDPTVSSQMKVGFEAVQLLPNYISDPTCDNYAVLIRLRADQDLGDV